MAIDRAFWEKVASGIDKEKKPIHKKRSVKELADREKLFKERMIHEQRAWDIMNAAREDASREIVYTLQKHPGKYVVTDKTFVVAERIIGEKRVYAKDKYGNPTDINYMKKREADETRVKTFTPIKGYPGMYEVAEEEYKNGKSCLGTMISTAVITWGKLKEMVNTNQKLYQERKEAGLFYPDNMLATNDGKSFDTIKKDWIQGEKALLDNMPPKKYTLDTKDYTNEDWNTYLTEKRRFNIQKDQVLGKLYEDVVIREPFSFVTCVANDSLVSYGSDLRPYAKMLATGKPWQKSPIDSQVTVYTFTPISSIERENGKFMIQKETFRKGKSIGKSSDGPVSVSWKNMKDMVDMERKIHDAHVKAGGKFYPANTLLLKDDREFEDFKARTNRRVKNAKGIRRKETKQKGMEI